jgi:hypothetical protein
MAMFFLMKQFRFFFLHMKNNISSSFNQNLLLKIVWSDYNCATFRSRYFFYKIWPQKVFYHIDLC